MVLIKNYSWVWPFIVAAIPIIFAIGVQVAQVLQHKSDNDLAKTKSDNETRLKEEIAKIESDTQISIKQMELEKIKLDNHQKNYETIFPRTQQLFEEYIIQTKIDIERTAYMPVSFSERQKHLEVLVALYSPGTQQSIRNLHDINTNDVPRNQMDFALNSIVESLSSKISEPSQTK